MALPARGKPNLRSASIGGILRILLAGLVPAAAGITFGAPAQALGFDPPPTAPFSAVIAENAPAGTEVFRVQVTTNPGEGPVTYSLLGGGGRSFDGSPRCAGDSSGFPGAFEIDGEGRITSRRSFNWELGERTYAGRVKIRAPNGRGGTASLENCITVTVTDVDERGVITLSHSGEGTLYRQGIPITATLSDDDCTGVDGCPAGLRRVWQRQPARGTASWTTLTPADADTPTYTPGAADADPDVRLRVRAVYQDRKFGANDSVNGDRFEVLTATDPAGIRVVVDPDSPGEGGGAQTVRITVETTDGRSFPDSRNVRIMVAGSGDTDRVGFTLNQDLFSFVLPANSTRGEGTFILTPVDDQIRTADEVVTITAIVVGLTGTATLTIIDDDQAVVTLDDAEVNEAQNSVTVMARLDRGAPGSHEVAVSTMDGTATAPGDYTATSTTLTFTVAAGTRTATQTFTVPIADDGISEEDETFTLSLGPLSATPRDADLSDTATVTILDDDIFQGLALSFDRDAVFETEHSVDFRTVLLEFDPPLTEPAPITYRFNNPGDTATWPADYNYLVSSIPAVSSSFSPSNPIPAGTATASFIIVLRITNDRVTEDPEFLTLSATVPGYTVRAATLTIADTGTTITLEDVEVDEDAGMATVAATLNGAVPGGLTARLLINDGTATVGEDYAAASATQLTFSGTAGETREFTVPIVSDSISEGNETFTVSVSGVSGNAVVDTSDTATVTIIDDDVAPTKVVLSLSQTDAVAEGASATVAVTAAFPPGTAALGSDTVVTVAVGDIGDSAAEGTDYNQVGDLTLTILKGTSSVEGMFEFVVLDDDVADPDETVSVSGTAPDFTVTGTSLTITDTDTAPTEIVLSLSQTDAVAEGARATVTVTATLSPETITLGSETVVMVTVGAGDDSATEGPDYTTVGDLTLTIAAEATSGTVEFLFDVLGDGIFDPDETVTVSGTSAGFIFTNESLSLAITDTNTAPTGILLSLGDADTADTPEGTERTVTVAAFFPLGSATLTSDTVMTIAVGDSMDTATAGTDYTMVGDLTLTIAAGESMGTVAFTLTALDDDVADPGETVTVSGTSDDFIFTNESLSLAIADTDTAPTEIVLSLSPADAVSEGASATVTVTATLSPDTITLGSDTVVTVAVGEVGDPAIEGTDYDTVEALTLTIAAEESSGTVEFTLTALDDDVADPGETVTVSGTSGSFRFTNASLTITDIDMAPMEIVLSLSPADAVAEGASATVMVTASFPPGSPTLTSDTVVTVAVGDGGDTAMERTDYTAVGDLMVTIRAGESSGTGEFMFAVADDDIADPGETVTVSGTAEGFSFTNASLTITDTDAAPTEIVLSLSPASAAEGARATVTVMATLSPDTITLGSDTVVTVTVGDSGDPAVEGTDYTAVGDLMVTIQAGESSGTGEFVFAVMDNTVVDGDRTVTVSGSADETVFTQGVMSTVLVITDDDSATVTLGNKMVGESDGTVTVTATLDVAVPGGFTVDFSIDDGMATAGGDYRVPGNLMVRFDGTAGEEKSVRIGIVNDRTVEGNETFQVSLGNLGGIAGSADLVIGAPATVTIIDDDTTPTGVALSLAPMSVAEGSGDPNRSGAVEVIVTASFLPGSGTLTTDTEVAVSVAGGTATAGVDFSPVPAFMVTIAAGGSSGEGRFDLVVDDDRLVEGNETVTVSGMARVLTVAPAMLTITDNDAAPTMITLSLNPMSEIEGSSGNTPAGSTEVMVTASFPPDSSTLTTATEVAISVAGGTATAGADFTAVSAFTVTIAAGDSSGGGRFALEVLDDRLVEGDETVTVSGTAAAEFTGGVTSAELTITDDDSATVTLGGETVGESAGVVTVTATLDVGVEGGFTVDVSTADGTATVAGGDYSEVVGHTLTFSGMAGETETFTVAVEWDSVAEGEETFRVSLASLGGIAESADLMIGGPATVTIRNEPSMPTVTLGTEPLFVPESAGLATFTVTLNAMVPAGFTVDVSIEDVTATAGRDYMTDSVRRLIFDGNRDEMRTFTVEIVDDDVVERDETFRASLSGISNVGVGFDPDFSTATVQILDNDGPAGITLEVADATVDEGGTVTVTARLDTPVEEGVTIQALNGPGGTAIVGSDYTALVGETLTFAGTAGETETFEVEILDDNDAEGPETFLVKWGLIETAFPRRVRVPPADPRESYGKITITILDNDPATVTLTADNVDEDGGSVTVTASLDIAVPGGFTLSAQNTDGTAVAGSAADYAPVSESLRFTGTAGETLTFDVPIWEDRDAEGDETFTIGLSGLVHTEAMVVADSTVTVTIRDNDEARVTLQSETVNEAAGTVTVTAQLDVAVPQGFTTLAILTDGWMTDSAAMLGQDYRSTGTGGGYPLAFRGHAGETRTFTVDIIDDSEMEGEEAFTVALSMFRARATTSPTVDISSSARIGIVENVAPMITLEAARRVGEGVGTVEITARLDIDVQLPFLLEINYADPSPQPSASALADYTVPSDLNDLQKRFAGNAGETQTFTVTIVDDTVVEEDENLRVWVQNLAPGLLPEGGQLAEALITIVDNDLATVTLTADPVTEGAGPVTITASLDVAVSGGFTVEASTRNLTAQAGSDYVAARRTLAFLGNAGEMHTFPVEILDSPEAEGVENFGVVMGNLASTSAEVDISDSLRVTILPAGPGGVTVEAPDRVPEGASSVAVTVRSNVAVTEAFTVELVAESAGTAPAGLGSDFRAVAESDRMLEFTGTGSQAHTVEVLILQDFLVEGDETFRVRVHQVSGTEVQVGGAATITIIDDDAAEVTLEVDRSMVAENGGMATVTARLDTERGGSVPGGFEVDVSTGAADGTNMATERSDYTEVSGQTLTFAGTADETKIFTVSALDDDVFEGDETFTIRLGNLAGTSARILIGDTATVTIIDDDTAPTGVALSLDPMSVAEGSGDPNRSGAVEVIVTASFLPGSGTLTTDTKVAVSVAGGTAMAGVDFSPVPAFMVTIAAGGSSGEGRFDLVVVDDRLVEGSETVTVSGMARVLTVAPAMLTITDNDAAPTMITLSLNPMSEIEGSNGNTPAGLTGVMVTASFPPDSSTLTTATEVAISVAGGTATAGADFTEVSAFTVTIAAGDSSGGGRFDLEVLDDRLVEGDETVTVSGTAAAEFTGGVTSAELTIIDDDSATVTLGDKTVGESAGVVTVTATLDVGVEGGFTVDVSTADGTATVAGGDYSEVVGHTLTFSGMAGETETFTVAVAGDSVAEGEETFRVSLANLGGIAESADLMIGGPATVTIRDDDTAPTAIVLSLSPADAVAEGASATVTVTATLSPDTTTLGSDTVVTVAVGAGTDSAAEGTDYTTVVDLTLTIAAEAASGMVEFEFAPLDDTVADPGETVSVSGTSGSFSFTNTSLAITDTDTAPTEIVLSLSEAGAAEGASATVTVTATLSPDTTTLGSDTVVTVTVGDSGDSATEGTDYTEVDDLVVTIGAGESSGTGEFVFAVADNTVVDGDRTVTVSGSADETVFTQGVMSAVLVITDDDSATVTLGGDKMVGESDGVVTVTATLDVAVPGGFTVDFSIDDGTATEGGDYRVPGNLMVQFDGTAGEEKSVRIRIMNDATVEGNETFQVSLGNLGGIAGSADLVIGAPATVTIIDDDTAPTGVALSLDPMSVAEGGGDPNRSGAVEVIVTASFLPGSGTLTTDTEVAVSVADGTAMAGVDFSPVPAFMVTIAAGESSGEGRFDMVVVDDRRAEGDETVTVSGMARVFTVAPAMLTITDNDDAPTMVTLSLNPESETEGSSGNTLADSTLVMVTASFPPGSPTLTGETVVTVMVGGSMDSASEGIDYTTVEDLMVTIAAGASSGAGSFDLEVLDDRLVEGDETVTVSGTAAAEFTDGVVSAVLTITDDDTAPTAIVLSLSETGASEGASATVTVTASFPPNSSTLTSDTVVTVAVGDGGDAATEGTDYTTVTDLTLTIPAGDSSVEGTFAFAALDDDIFDPGETVTVSGTSGSFSFTNTSLAITDTDTAPTAIVLSVSEAGASEGASATVTVTAAFPGGSATLTSDTVVTVAVGDGGDTATEGTDYTTVTDLTLTIPAGDSSVEGTFAFVALDDDIFDPGETVTVSGTSGSFTFTDTSLVITDTDTAPTAIVLSLSETGASEGASATVTVTATLSPASTTLTSDTVVTVAVGAGVDSATEGTDYTMVGDLTLTIAAEAASGTVEFDFTALDDDIDDSDETVTVSGATAAPGFSDGVTAATLTINDNDTAGVTISESTLAVDEGAERTYTVVLDSAPTGTATVTIDPGTSTTAPIAITPSTLELIFDSSTWSTAQTVTVTASADDDVVGGTRTLRHTVANYGSVTAADVEVTVTDTDRARVTLGDSATVTVQETDGTTTLTVTARLNGGAVPGGFLVRLQTLDGTALPGSDYTDTTGTLTFLGALGETQDFEVEILGDRVAEDTEQFSVRPRGRGVLGTPHSVAVSPGITVTIEDNDTAGVTISESTLAVTEGSQQTYTVVLNSAPAGTATVTIVEDSSATAPLTVTPSTLTLEFDSGNWDSAQTVTVAADEDDDAAGGTRTLEHAVTGYGSVATASSVEVTVTDNDTAGVTVSESTLAVTEGSQQTYTVVLNSAPAGTATVTIVEDSSATAPLTVTPSTLTLEFDSGNWDSAQTVTVAADEDDDAAGGTRTLGHTVTGYGSVATASSVEVTVTDNDTAGVTISESTLAVTEGSQQTYTVVLDSEPTGTATVTIVEDSSTTAPLTVTPSTLTLEFDSGNWDSAQTVTVAADEDDDAAGGTRTLEHTVTGYGSVATASSVEVTVTDNDTAGVTVSESTLAVTEGSQQTYTVVLDSEPTGTATVTIVEDSSTTAPLTVTPSTLTLEFDSGNWDSAQTVTVAADEDDDAAGGTRTLGHTVTGYGSVATASSVEVTVTDNDTAGVTVSESTLAVTEGSQQTYTVVLNSAPAGTATVTIVEDSSTTAPLTVTPSTLTLEFDSGNWDSAQTVTVAADEDDDAAGGTRTLGHTVTGYGSVATASSVEVTVTDNDTAGVTVSESTLAVTEGSQQTYTVVLNSAPAGTATVTIVEDSSTTAPLTVTPSTLTLEFDSGNWDSAQTVTVAADEDDDAAGGTRTLGHTVTGYGSVATASSVEVTVTDNDTAGVSISESTLAVTEGSQQTYTVVLNSAPAGTATVTIVEDSSATAPLTVTPSTLTLEFDSGNWDSAQTVTVAADEDDDAAGGTRTLEHTVTGYGSVATASSVEVTVTDNDTAGVTISESTLAVTEGSQQTYTVVLDSAPAGTATVTIVEDSSTTAPLTVTPSTLTLEFDSGNWDSAQTVAVVADEDDDAAGGTRTLGHTVTGYGSVATASSVEVTVTDNDTAGVTVSESTLAVTEGSQQTYTVVLNSAPAGTATVTIVEDSSTTAPLTVTPSTLTLEFDSGNWDSARTVTVAADEDDDAAGGTRTLGHTVTGYGSVATALSVEVTVTDNDTAGVTISESTLAVTEGSQQTYTVVLNSAPAGTATVTIVEDSSSTAPLTLTPSTLTLEFDSGNWDSAQTVTVAADEDDDAAGGTRTLGHTVTGYGSVATASSVEVTVTDNDTAGVTISESTLAVTEGSQQTYTVVLDSAPAGTATVTIVEDSSTTAPITVTPSTLTLEFDSGNWDSAQTVTVAADEDGDAAGGTRTLGHTVTGYGSVTAGNVVVTVTDNDTAGVTISESTLAVTEGSQQTYTVVLDSAPAGTATVTIVEDSSTTAPLTVTPSTLTLEFDSGNWDSAQTVTVAADEDDDAAGGTRTLEHTVTGYGSVATAASVVVTVTDNDIPGVTISESTLAVTEGSQQTYTVRLNTAPAGTATVTIVEDSSTTAPLTVTPSTLTLEFDSGNWDSAQTVTVAADEDDDAAGGTRTLEHTVTGYGSVATAASVEVTVTDNDIPGVTISESALAVTEGSQQTYTVRLNTAPAGTVTVTIVEDSSTTAPLTVTPSTLTLEFDSGNWDSAQTVTVAADEDDDAAGGTRTLGHTVTGYGSVATAPSVVVTVTDNDTAGVTVSESTLAVTEGSQQTYTVVLNSAPAGTATVTIVEDSSSTAPLTVTPSTLTLEFDSGNWDSAQTVTVAADEDDDAAGGTRTLGHTVTGYGSVATASSVEVTVTDNDTAGVTISESTLAVTEGSQQTYTVVLDSAPAGTATVTIVEDSSTTAPITVTPSTLTLEFDSGNWDSARTVTVAADEDGDAAGGTRTLGHTVTGYGSVTAGNVVVTVTDNDTAGVTISESTLAVTEGSQQTYTVVLDSAPAGTATVTIVEDSSTTAPLTVTPSTLTLEFDSGNWDSAQTVTVAADEDDDAAGGTRTLEHTVTGYGSVATAASVVVTVTDNDIPGVTISESTLAVTEGSQQTYTVVLNSAPAGTATVTIVEDSSTTAPLTVTPSTLTLEFDSGNWDSAQTVTVAADEDDDAAGGTRTLEHTVTGYGSVATAASVEVTVTDNDTAGVTVSESALSVNEGAQQTYTVRLNTAPAGTATVTIVEDSSTTAPLTVTPSTLTLEFDSGNWDSAQTVTVAADEDDDAAGGTRTLGHTVTGYGSVATAPSVVVTVTDNDTAGVTISESALAVTEGSQQTYTVVLNSAPAGTATVTIVEDSSTTAPLTVTPSTLTLEFDSGNWDSAQTVTVAADEDDDAAGGTRTLEHTVTGYGSVTAGNVVVTVTDNDTAGVTISESALAVTEGSQQTYTVVLNSAPAGTATVTIVEDSSTTAPLTVTPSTLTLEFDSGNWDSAQTVTVAADEDDDAAGGTRTLEHTVTGYGSVTAGNVVVTVTDNDTAGVTVSESTLAVTEGSQQTYTVVLNSAPAGTATVTIVEDSSTTAPLTVTPSTLTLEFDSGTWDSAQTVTVAADEDGDAAGGTRTLEHTVTGYGSVATAASVVVTVTDNDIPGVTISESTLAVTEGSQQTYTVVLDSEPTGTATVTIVPGTSTTAPISVTPATLTLTFDASTWNTAQPVTVAADEDDDTAGGTRTLEHTVTGYGSVATAASVVVTVIDNDRPGVTISESALAVTEEGPEQTYTVVLDTQPAGEVEVAIDPGSSTTAPITVTPALVLTFGTGTWATAQTVTVTATADDDTEGGTRTLSHTVTGYGSVATAAPVTVTVTDNDTEASTRIALYLDPATVAEDIGYTTITVMASLPEGSPPMAAAAEVEIQVMDGTAVGGADFTPVPGFMVTIAADTTSGMASFDLEVIHDAQMEGDETLMVVGEAVGYTVASATLTIVDRSAVDAALLETVGANLAREVFANVSGVVVDRVNRLIADRLSASVGRLDLQASLARGLAASEQALNDGSLSWRKLLDGSFLEVPLGDGADTASLSDSGQPEPAGLGLWAAGEARLRSDDGGDFGAWDSDVLFTHVGVDLPIGRRGLGGLAVSSSRGSFNFERDEFDTDTRLLNYTLYYGMPVGNTGNLWATAGYGTGELVTGQSGSRNTRDMKMTMVIAGGRQNVAWGDGLALDFEGEVWAGRLIPEDADDGGDFATEISRLNLALDLERRWKNDSGVSFVRSIKLEAQLDNRAPGSGAAIEGRLGHSSPDSGLTSSLTGDFLLFNEEGLKGGGVSGSLLYRPGLQGRGLSFRADSSYSAGKTDLSRLWRDSGISIGDSSGAAVFELEAGYGLPVLGGIGVLTPYYGFEFTGEGARRHRLGNRVKISQALELEVEGAYLEKVPGEHAERRLDLRLRMQW